MGEKPVAVIAQNALDLIQSLESQLKEEQRVREYIFSILTKKQIEEYLDWEDSDDGA